MLTYLGSWNLDPQQCHGANATCLSLESEMDKKQIWGAGGFLKLGIPKIHGVSWCIMETCLKNKWRPCFWGFPPNHRSHKYGRIKISIANCYASGCTFAPCVENHINMPGSSKWPSINHQFKVTYQKGHHSPPPMGHFEEPGANHIRLSEKNHQWRTSLRGGTPVGR